MITREQLINRASYEQRAAKTILDKFQADLAKDPVQAMGWHADHAIAAAACFGVWRAVEQAMLERPGLGVATVADHALRETLNGASLRVGQSTSVSGSEMDRQGLKAWVSVYQICVGKD